MSLGRVIAIPLIMLMGCSIFQPKGTPKPKPDNGGNVDITPPAPKPDQPPKPTPKPPKPTPKPDLHKDAYRVSLVLPLYAEYDSVPRNFRGISDVGRAFYAGALIAADSLAKCGMRLTLDVVDAGTVIPRSERWTANPPDMVIAGLTEKDFTALHALLPLRTLIVNSLSVIDTCLNDSFYIQSTPSARNFAKAALEVIADSFKDCRIYQIYDKGPEKNLIAEEFKLIARGDSFTNLPVASSFGLLENPKLQISPKTVIFLPTRNEVFVQSVINQLTTFEDKDIVIIGVQSWLGFRTFEGSQWEKFRVRVLTSSYVDLTSAQGQKFVRDYRGRYNDEPSEWAVRGYGEMMLWAGLLQAYGLGLRDALAAGPVLYTFNMRFAAEPAQNCGYINLRPAILRFNGYKLNQD